MGFLKPQTETIIKFVSTGIKGWTNGEKYCESPDALRRLLEYVDPVSAPKKYCVIKPVSLFKTDELSFTISFKMFTEMLKRYDESFLKEKTWQTVQKKIARSKKAWGESPEFALS